MASNIINVTETCEVNGGPKISEIVGYTCDAYEVIEVVLPGPTTKKEIVIQGAGSEMSLLQVSVPSGVYGTAPYITYQLLSDTMLAIDLTNMHQFVGRGAIQALMEGVTAKAEITKIYLTNVHTSSVTVRILVGKDVTP
jgi:hypothetical protein